MSSQGEHSAMIRRIPVFSTLLVLAAVAAMVSLGVWQLHRLKWKEALLARYASVEQTTAPVAWPTNAAGVEADLFRRSSLDCAHVTARNAVAGRSAKGEIGWAETVTCSLPQGGTAQVVLGWSLQPRESGWNGGDVTGFIAPGAKDTARMVADPPIGGLDANARPDPSEIPNNHFFYAVQWFTFAGAALVIYVLALRQRLRGA